ncbi:hypothetical protein NKH72_21930 [Mesorhizobium sp. M0955]|uniref:hypothetical protein n=1 Tax=Mesorhizobium sp. M0955 TaxID=2957033 RepID=UPI00333BD18B
MKYAAIILLSCLLTGCGSARFADGGRNNVDYARNCGMAMDELGMCNSYVSPHEF